MWYLKTKLGTLWIVEADDEPTHCQYVLGMDEDSLGVYESVERAISDVCNHETGALKWDESLKAEAPSDINGWIEGQPESWN